jgi:hypothetical protein
VLADAKRLLVLSQTHESIVRVNKLLRNAYTLQHELFSWELNMPSQFGYRTIDYIAPNNNSEPESEIIRSEV